MADSATPGLPDQIFGPSPVILTIKDCGKLSKLKPTRQIECRTHSCETRHQAFCIIFTHLLMLQCKTWSSHLISVYIMNDGCQHNLKLICLLIRHNLILLITPPSYFPSCSCFVLFFKPRGNQDGFTCNFFQFAFPWLRLADYLPVFYEGKLLWTPSICFTKGLCVVKHVQKWPAKCARQSTISVDC